jgi:hypothetical protein
MRLAAILVLLSALTLSAAQNNQFVQLGSFPAPQGYNPRSPEGTFDLILQVDGEAFVYVQGKNVKYLPLSGAPIQDKGNNYTQEVPRAVFSSFHLAKVTGSGDVSLQEPPNEKNDYTAVVRVNDKRSGSDLYHIRLSWTWDPSNPMQQPVVARGGNRVPVDNRDNDYRRGREGSFQVRGTVDDVTVLYITGDRVRVEDLSGRPLRGDQVAFSQPLPYERLRSIQLVDVQGRGDVELVEKPWEGNKFTAVVLVSDPQRGASSYSFRLVWSR